MTTYSEAIAAMHAYFNSLNLTGMQAELYDDHDPEAIPDSGPWLRFNVRHNDGGQKTMGAPGNNRFERSGLITIQLFDNEGKSMTSLEGHVNSILDHYDGVTDSGITYSKAQPREIGPDGYGWFQINVLVEFRYSNLT